ncbi:helix-turn-helix domain-containing protein [Nostoc sp. FACHB-152]|nr:MULTISPECIES: helix-turn-helix domain-containing protein [unclassified Nostoc]MBD2448058.1 helix-turn-helix domain-containing protein [Nostoc sp. FACHB-152]MBD2466165.1 helix-turn-helix domain-containing protein [Nostoc sp. FACHB-145]
MYRIHKFDLILRLKPEHLNEISKVLNCQPGELLQSEPDIVIAGNFLS